jgi:hypothetical protein
LVCEPLYNGSIFATGIAALSSSFPKEAKLGGINGISESLDFLNRDVPWHQGASLGKETAMSKKRTYTVPVTLRLSPGMMEVVDEQARKRGVTAVDWIRHAIAFTFEEESYLRSHLSKIGERPCDYLADFEDRCDQLDDPDSPLSQEHRARMANFEKLRSKGIVPEN